MTDPTPTLKSFRESLALIDESIPLKTPLVQPFDMAPRLERAEKKVAFLTDYVEFLEGRIAALETGAKG